MKTTLEEFLKGRRWAVTREGVESRENILSDRNNMFANGKNQIEKEN